MFIPTYIKFAVLGLSVISTLLLAIIVDRNNQKSATNKIFGLLSLVTCIWLMLTFISSDKAFLEYYLILARATIFFAVPQSTLFFLLAHTLPNQELVLSKRNLKIIIFFSIVVMALTLSQYVFTDVKISNGLARLVPGLGMPFFVLFVSTLSLGAIFVLFKKIHHSQGLIRRQLCFMLSGILLMLGFIIFTIMIPVIFLSNDFFIPFAPLYALIFICAAAIAILKYHLFNVKLIATEILVAILVLVLIFEGLLSNSLITIFYKIFFSGFVGIVGLLLIKSVRKEVEQRERLEVITKELQIANERLREIDRQKTDFLSIAAHQLRTPLSIINGYIELIKDGAYGKIKKPVKEILVNMDESNARLVKLVDDFLDITRIEQGRTKYDFVAHNFNAVIESVVSEFHDRAGQKGLKISWHPAEGLGKVAMDEEKIRHVVFNFIDNAIKYSETGTISVIASVEEEGVQLVSRDKGIGFDKTDEANFFQKFYRGNNVKNTNVNGTGLGLYVCSKFIEAHNGRIWAHSPGLGKGSEFGFWIPLKQN